MVTRAQRPPTARQLVVLRTIAAFIRRNGYPPTLKELCRMLEIRSLNAMHEHLVALEVKGLISRGTKIARSIRITEEGQFVLRDPVPAIEVDPRQERLFGKAAS